MTDTMTDETTHANVAALRKALEYAFDELELEKYVRMVNEGARFKLDPVLLCATVLDDSVSINQEMRLADGVQARIELSIDCRTTPRVVALVHWASGGGNARQCLAQLTHCSKIVASMAQIECVFIDVIDRIGSAHALKQAFGVLFELGCDERTRYREARKAETVAKAEQSTEG